MLSIAANVSTITMMHGRTRLGSGPIPMPAPTPVTSYRAAVIGQSENVVGWLDNGPFATSHAAANDLYQPIAAGVDVEIGIPVGANSNNAAPFGLYPVTQQSLDAGTLSPGAVAIANLWHMGSNGAALRLAGVCKSGTGMPEMLDDDDPDRDYADDAALVAAAEAAWGPVERVLYNWYVSEAPASATLWENRSAAFFGLNPDGTDYDFAAGALEHCLIDRRATQTGGDLGLLGPQVKVDVMYPGATVPFWSQDAIDPPNPNYTTDASGAAHGGRIDLNGPPAYRSRRDFLDAAPADNAGLATISPALAVMGDYAGGTAKQSPNQVSSHPALQSKYGQNLYSQDVGFALLCGFGFAQPTRLDRVEVEETGAHADFVFSLPAGARLRTHRDVDGLTVTDPRPHQQPVMGFVIRRSGDTVRSERPVYRTDVTDALAYPPAYRGTVAIQGDGSTGVVRVTPEQPFENGDVISFGQDAHYGGFVLHGFEDFDAQLCLDGLRAYEPRLDDGTAFRYPGGPVVNQEAHTVAGLAGGNQAPVAVTVTRSTGSDPQVAGPEVGPGITAITMLFEGTIGEQTGSGRKGILSLSALGLRLEANTSSNKRAARLIFEDGTGNVLASAFLGSNSLSPSGDLMRCMITATQDDGTGTWRLGYYLNDGLVGSVLSGPSSAAAEFQSGQTYELLPSNMAAGIGRMVIWASGDSSAYSADGAMPSAAPLVTLQGDAAYWNGAGLPAGWSAQGTGTWSDL